MITIGPTSSCLTTRIYLLMIGLSYLINLVRQPKAAIRITLSSIHAANPEHIHTTNEFLFQPLLSTVITQLSIIIIGRVLSTILNKTNIMYCYSATHSAIIMGFRQLFSMSCSQTQTMPYDKDFLYLAILWWLFSPNLEVTAEHFSERQMAFQQIYILLGMCLAMGFVCFLLDPLIYAAKNELTILAKSAVYPKCGHSWCNLGATSKPQQHGLTFWVSISNGLGRIIATHESQNFWGYTPKMGTTSEFKFSKLADIVKQIVYIGVIVPAESKSGLDLGLLLHCHFGSFCRKYWKILKN